MPRMIRRTIRWIILLQFLVSWWTMTTQAWSTSVRRISGTAWQFYKYPHWQHCSHSGWSRMDTMTELNNQPQKQQRISFLSPLSPSAAAALVITARRAHNSDHHEFPASMSPQPNDTTKTTTTTSSSSESSSLPTTAVPILDGENMPTFTSVSSSSPLATINTIVTFPCLNELLRLQPGEFVTSQELIRVPIPNSNAATTACFQIKLYPKGGGHTGTTATGSIAASTTHSRNTGFGMSYQIRPSTWFLRFLGQTPGQERVGAYLQFLPSNIDEIVDVTFALRLLGQQTSSISDLPAWSTSVATRATTTATSKDSTDTTTSNENNNHNSTHRMAIEWRAGIRMTSLEAHPSLVDGTANDFGAHFMHTAVLPYFLGISETGSSDNYYKPVQMQVMITLHGCRTTEMPQRSQNEIDHSRSVTTSSITQQIRTILGMQDVRKTGTVWTRNSNKMNETTNTREPLRVGQVVVPVLQKLTQRPRMMQQGIYPGVEYRILRMIDTNAGTCASSSSILTGSVPVTTAECEPQEKNLLYHQDGVDYEMKPIYPLVRQLVRPWPVRVNEKDIPVLLQSMQYNLLSAAGSLAAAVTGLLAALIISQAISVFVIPSRSMDPTLRVGDVLLVDKITPRIQYAIMSSPTHQSVGDIVLFHPPAALRDLVQTSGGRLSDRDLFIKRIAAVSGDTVQIQQGGGILINGQITTTPRRDLCRNTGQGSILLNKFIPADTEPIILLPNQVTVLGDCAAVSIDSRVWGPLSVHNIIGRPLLRLWPLERWGPIPSVTTTNMPAPTTTPTTTDSAMQSWLQTDWK